MRFSGLHICLIIFCFLLFACHKDSQTNTCVSKTYILTPFIKQFKFQSGSYWLYQSSTNSNIDSMIFGNTPQSSHYVHLSPQISNSSNSCYSYETYLVSFSHMLFQGADYFTYTLDYDKVFIDLADDYNPSYGIALINSATPDSIHTNYGGGTWVKLEKKFDSLTVLGSKYTNVYQMRYTPAINKFQRIWWCPNVGFVKFEFINLQSTIDTWELKKSHVVL